EDPKNPPADGKAPDGAETPIAMIPEGAEKTPKDGKNAEGTMMPPPMSPEKAGDAALPALPTPGAPAPGDGKTAENILPVLPADGKVPDAKQPEKPAVVAVPPVQPAPPAPPPAAPANNNQIAVVIPKAPTTTVAVAPPPSPPPGDTNATPMRTMAGVYRVQVASTRSETAAKSMWKKQVNKHPDVLGKLPLTVQTAVIQDRGTFYRVQGGAFGDREAADSVCRKLKSRGQDCIVVRP
ncbi:MAG: SPOR domain-containing protein, partial [Proteobacteria bacterium]|nr:SPOR domain-containing protein [Pseudomonadota bacterium]